jgi:hypothetical protein
MKKIVITEGVSLWLAATCLVAATSASAESLRHVTSEECGACHEKIYQQWKRSMHANSTALKDPIHGAFYRKVVGDPLHEGVRKGGKYPICMQCHVPTAAKDGKTKLDANPAYTEGVNCVSCHTLTKYKGQDWTPMKLGLQAYEYSDTHLQGPSGENYTTEQGSGIHKFHPYPMRGNQELMKTNAACLGCHDKRNNPKGTPLCRTGDEIEMTGYKGGCNSCHMPKVDGIADHTMLGGHSAEMVGSGVVLKLEAEPKGEQIEAKLTLENVLPHGFPTGAPFRNMVVKLLAYDAEGNLVWSNFQTDPGKEDPQAQFKLTLGDAEGKPTSPPHATQILSDTRLKPHEIRTLFYEIPMDGRIAKLRAEAYYNLLWPNLVKMLDQQGVLTPDLKEPKLIGVSEVFLPEKLAEGQEPSQP